MRSYGIFNAKTNVNCKYVTVYEIPITGALDISEIFIFKLYEIAILVLYPDCDWLTHGQSPASVLPMIDLSETRNAPVSGRECSCTK